MSRHPAKAAPRLLHGTKEPGGQDVLATLRKHQSELQRVNRTLRTISSCNQALIHATTECGLLAEVCRVIVEEGGYRLAWVGYAENDPRKTVRPVASAGYEAGYLERVDITWADEPRGQGPTGTAIRTRQPAVCRDMQTDRKFAPWRKDALRRGYAASIVLPLLDQGTAFGAVSIYATEPNAFDPNEVKLLQELAEDLVFGILALRSRLAHQEAAEALRRANAYNRSLLEASLDPLATVGLDGRITDVNAATEMATGRTRAELVGTDFSEYFTEPENARAGYAQVLRDGLVRDHPLELRHRDGRVTPVVYNASVYRDERGAVIGVFAAARDITELKRVEAEVRALNATLEQRVAERSRELATSEERLRSVLRATATGTFEIDLQTGEGRWNEVEFELLGLKPGEGAPVPATFFRYVHPDDIGPLGEKWEQAKRSGELDAEFRVVRADGQLRWLAGKGHFSNAKHTGTDHCVSPGKPLRFLGVNFDITERKRAEEDLRQSERLYRSIGETINYGVWVCAPDGRNTYASDSFLKMVGLTQEQCSNFGWGAVLHPDDAERTIVAWQECVRTKGHWDIEHRFRGVDGEWHPVLARGIPVRDADGKIQCWAGINLDISNLKRAEQALRESRQDLDRAQQVGQIGSWRLDVRRNCLTWSEENHRIFGVPPGTPLTYESFLGIVHPDDRACVDGQWQAGLGGAPYDIEHRIVADGRVKWVREKAYLEFDEAGRLLGGFGITQDITERKLAEQALRESEQRLSLAVDAAQAGVWDWDVTTGRLEWSPQQFRMFGLDPVRAEASFESWRGVIHPTDRCTAEARIQAAVAQRTRLENEYRVVLPSGEIRWISALGDATYDASGRPLRMSGVCLDITARKRAEVELRNMAAKLQASNRELESFSYSVSHDLRAPLRSIDGFSRILLEDCADKLDENSRDNLRRVRAASQRMGELIDDLLKLSRAGRTGIECVPLDLSALVLETVADLRQAEPTRQVECVVAQHVSAMGDRTLLRAVLENLVGNAWKFTAPRTGARIEFGETVQDGERVFFIRDNGVGFDMAYAGKLFAPFQRLHAQAEFSGHGIGLATVQRIIHRHGGRVWAEGRADHGATFYFTLPRPSPPP